MTDRTNTEETKSIGEQSVQSLESERLLQSSPMAAVVASVTVFEMR